MKKYTAIIIGAGPAGYTCAVRLAQLGANVAIVERDFIGGICVNWGCTPSKAMIESAKIANVVSEAEKYGVNVSGFSIDFVGIAARRDKVVKAAREEVTELLKHYNIDIYQGEAEITTINTVAIHEGKLDIEGNKMDFTGKKEEISGDHIILSTGSKPLIPGFIDENDPTIVNSNRLITIHNLPKTLTVVGGGVIGLEFATIFSNLGTKVTIIEYQDRVLYQMDPDISHEITSQLEKNGVKVLTNHKVLSIKDGLLKAENQDTKEVVEITSKMNLIAIGRRAVVDYKTYDLLGLKYSDNGIKVNEYLQTNVKGIWSIGDATGESILAHVGIQQGIICAENIMDVEKGKSELRAMNYDVIPAVIYTLPEIVGVGIVPKNLDGIIVSKVPFTANLRANIEENNTGFVKIWVKDNKVLAAQIIGYNVSEIAQELANMIELKTDINNVATIIHAHPTYAEITRTVLENALGKAIEFYEVCKV